MNTKSLHCIQPYYKKHLLNLYWLQLLQINLPKETYFSVYIYYLKISVESKEGNRTNSATT